MKTCITLALVFCTAVALAQTPNADEKAIRDLDKAWVQGVLAKDVDKAVAPYADNASMFPDKGPIATGKNAIREAWKAFLTDPNIVSIDFGTNRIEVSKSGDMAYDTGWTEIKAKDPGGNIVSEKGKYVVVWRKIGGTWKVVADIFNADK